MDATQIADAETAYLANCDYESDASGAKAYAFLAACRKLLLAPGSLSIAGRALSRQSLEGAIANVNRWLEMHELEQPPVALIPIRFARPA